MIKSEGYNMGLFSKKDKELEEVINQIRVDLSNNYKDNAVENIKKLEKMLEEKKAAGKLKSVETYEEMLKHFQDDVKNFKRTY
jgi:arginyl-tRNA synthetase